MSVHFNSGLMFESHVKKVLLVRTIYRIKATLSHSDLQKVVYVLFKPGLLHLPAVWQVLGILLDTSDSITSPPSWLLSVGSTDELI